MIRGSVHLYDSIDFKFAVAQVSNPNNTGRSGNATPCKQKSNDLESEYLSVANDGVLPSPESDDNINFDTFGEEEIWEQLTEHQKRIQAVETNLKKKRTKVVLGYQKIVSEGTLFGCKAIQGQIVTVDRKLMLLKGRIKTVEKEFIFNKRMLERFDTLEKKIKQLGSNRDEQ